MLKPESEVLASRLDAVLSEHVAGGVVGASLALVRPGEPVLTLAAGCADRESGAPLTPDRLFRTASTKKTWTAVAVLALVREGRVGLDQTIEGWFPRLPRAGEIRVRHLLSHRSGLPEIRGADAEGLGRRLDAGADRRLRAFHRHAERAGRDLPLFQHGLRAGRRDRRRRARRAALPLAAARGLRARRAWTRPGAAGTRESPANASPAPTSSIRRGPARRPRNPRAGSRALRHRRRRRPGHHAARPRTRRPRALHRADFSTRRASPCCGGRCCRPPSPARTSPTAATAVLVSRFGELAIEGHLGQLRGHFTMAGHHTASGITAVLCQNSAESDLEAPGSTALHPAFAEVFRLAGA